MLSLARDNEVAAAPVAGDAAAVAAIDVGTNAARLAVFRPLPGGRLETVHQERAAIRPGEGVFTDGLISPLVEARLSSTLARFQAVCRAHGAAVRAVATSALRQARNGAEVVARLRRQTGVALEIISGREEARLVCAAALAGARADQRAVVLDIGGGSTEIVLAAGDRPLSLWSLPLGAVRVTERTAALGPGPEEQAVAFMRRWAHDVLSGARLDWLRARAHVAVGTSGTIRAVVDFASDGRRRATAPELRAAVGLLTAMGPAWRRRWFDRSRADVILAGAVVLEAVMDRLGLEAVEAVDAGLREGVARDLLARGPEPAPARALALCPPAAR